MIYLKNPDKKIAGKIGDRVTIGANVTLMPGKKIGNDCKIDAGIIIWKDIPDGTIIRNAQRLLICSKTN